MSLFHDYNEIPNQRNTKPDNLVAMPVSSPCKTTFFNPKEYKKPKGLSIRSNSDMNVFHSTLPTSVKENIYNSKESKISKSKIIKRDNFGQQTYSLKRQWEFRDHENSNAEFEGLTPKGEKKESNKNKKIGEILDDKTFKKPLPPKKFVKQIRDPENLAYFYDAQDEFDHGYIETVEQEFMKLSKEKENVIPYEEKDEETFLSVEIPKLNLPCLSGEIYVGLYPPELPYISDDDSLS